MKLDKLKDIIDEKALQLIIEEFAEPASTKPPKEKGADAIKVGGYFVHGHWRKRGVSRRRRLRTKLRLVNK